MKIKNVISKSIAFAFIAIAMLSCNDDEGSSIGLTNLNLVFEDDFNGEAGAAINSEFWNFDIGTGQNGWGNQELQYYTDRPENVSLDGQGNMVITARRENFQGSAFTSARINTRDKVEQQYGRFEARIQMPGGRGVWPAFWMLGSNIETEPDDDPATIAWPFVGEIDVTEMRGQEPFRTIGSIHGPGYSGGGAISGELDLEDERFDTEFHEFAIEWSPDFIDYFIDGIRFNRITKDDIPNGADWVFDDQPFFILLNVAVGGTFVGFPVDSTPLPQQMIVDYVRIYEIAN
ncbi:glycosyl hydrolase family 16 [Dokdonia pacifica]|uniref:Glycosyl hydrolases family 16 n=1 Tax=Dokdonia pacifica TaxID=1627892 RepID=A0A238ZSJ2_9FLAO|nr:glycoside hydrolase family 16 protein [Dokdonia pacifica]GGG08266.1 glycosyl hydrolase family 16 [Dokdonia pacifica]SNR86169.1 Glycosyl hydrolases family 16 [Dokdonia pacifica]